jgi:xylulokinase
MTDPLVLGIDCSTTASTCIAWDATGRSRAEARIDFPLSNPRPQFYEQDADDWWLATGEAVRTVVDQVDVSAIQGLCITHQRETFVVCDREGAPRRPAIVWMDERCRAQVNRTQESDFSEAFHQLSGKSVCMTPSVFKVMWLQDQESSPIEDDTIVTDVHGFLLRRMLGRWVTSTACADPMGLVDMASADWSDDLLELGGLTRGQVPEIVGPGTMAGGLTEDAASHLGLTPGLAVFAGAGDGQAAGLGAGIVAPGTAYLNLGTAIVSGVWSGDYRTDRAFRTMFGAAPNSYFLETDLKGGTFTINWLLERWLPAGDRNEMLRELGEAATTLPPGSEGLMLVPYWAGVMNPYWDDDASGVVIGWRGHHGPAHLYRAILEGIAFEQRLHTDAVAAAAGTPIDTFIGMGGGTKSDLWCQIVADVTGRRVVRSASPEATALGAGILAAVGSGMHTDTGTAVDAMTSVGRSFEPGPDRPTYETLYEEVYSTIYPALSRSLGRLTELTGN